MVPEIIICICNNMCMCMFVNMERKRVHGEEGNRLKEKRMNEKVNGANGKMW